MAENRVPLASLLMQACAWVVDHDDVPVLDVHVDVEACAVSMLLADAPASRAVSGWWATDYRNPMPRMIAVQDSIELIIYPQHPAPVAAVA